MNVFSFDVAEHRPTWDQQGWVHIPNGTDPDFLAAALEIVDRKAREERPLAGKGIKGAKEQFVFEFPGDVDMARHLFEPIAALTGLDASAMCLSERHIKAYEDDADPKPSAHKDRFASQVAVGISLTVPEGSHLVIYPDTDRTVNPWLSTAHRECLEPDQQPDVVLAGVPEVEIYDAPGDVMMFPGSSLWHLRRNSAGTVNLYLKFNDFGADPLGEDPSTSTRRETTLALLRDGADVGAAVGAAVPVLSRRFDSIARVHRREGWPETLVADVWGQNPFPISEDEAALLRKLDGRTTVTALGGPELVARLAHRGAIDLLPPA